MLTRGVLAFLVLAASGLPARASEPSPVNSFSAHSVVAGQSLPRPLVVSNGWDPRTDGRDGRLEAQLAAMTTGSTNYEAVWTSDILQVGPHQSLVNRAVSLEYVAASAVEGPGHTTLQLRWRVADGDWGPWIGESETAFGTGPVSVELAGYRSEITFAVSEPERATSYQLQYKFAGLRQGVQPSGSVELFVGTALVDLN